MDTEVELHGKRVRLSLSPAAERALAQRAGPLKVEMELYFSCLIRKRVLFDRESPDIAYVRLSPNLEVAFRPVVSQGCVVKDTYEPILATVRLSKDIVPKWLRLDHRAGAWRGDFGFAQEMD